MRSPLIRHINFNTPTGVCKPHSCGIPPKHTRCIAGLKPPRETTHIRDVSWLNRDGDQFRIGYGGEQVRLDAAFANVACEAKATLGLFDVLPNVPPGLGDPRGL